MDRFDDVYSVPAFITFSAISIEISAMNAKIDYNETCQSVLSVIRVAL